MVSIMTSQHDLSCLLWKLSKKSKKKKKKLSYNGAHLLSEPFPFDQSVESRVILYRKQRLTRIVRESSSDIQCKVRKSNPFTKPCQLNLSNMHNI